MSSGAMDAYQGLKGCGIGLVASVPCINMRELIDLVRADPQIEHLAVTREEEGVGICAGYHLGGRRAAILMQNSGLGNSINALASLDMLYGIPLLMIISHRGVEGEQVSAQVPMGQLTVPLLEAMGLPCIVPEAGGVEQSIAQAWEEAERRGCPSTVLVRPEVWR
ncbi:MAG: sulfopyruvate decarboxylase subunit alpha [Methanomassiliicoccus sp.]|nr:sulfopyruvate decarboxylase subunit alpha [Methanomassiliicoccus sp.]